MRYISMGEQVVTAALLSALMLFLHWGERGSTWAQEATFAAFVIPLCFAVTIALFWIYNAVARKLSSGDR